MASIKIKRKGHYDSTRRVLKKALSGEYLKKLNEFGKRGVAILQNVTPKDTGLTAASWNYIISRDEKQTIITWTNSNTITNSTGYEFNIVMLLVYGHATRNGGWVEGHDFISESIKPLFDEMADKAWIELIKS